jgi:hypothetical protein
MVRTPHFGIALHGEVEAGLEAMGGRNLFGGRFAIGGDPALPEPVRGIARGLGVARQKPIALTRRTAEHGIGEAAKVARVAIGGDLVHGERNRGMVRHAHEEELGEGHFENAGERAGVTRRALDQLREDGGNGAVAAQGRGDDGAGEGAVAGREGGKSTVALQRDVQGLVAVEHLDQQAQRGVSGRRAFRSRGGIQREAPASEAADGLSLRVFNLLLLSKRACLNDV